MAAIEIAGRKVGDGLPCFVIAEAGVNHNGSLELACRLVDAAVAAGADAVKFQTFSAEDLVTETAAKADYQERALGSAESQFEMLKRLELSREDHFSIAAYAREKDMLFLSTPFDEGSVELLEEMGVAAFKMSSGDL